MKKVIAKKLCVLCLLATVVSCVGVEDLQVDEMNVQGNTLSMQGGQYGHGGGQQQGRYGQVIHDNFGRNMDVYEYDDHIMMGPNQYRLPPFPPPHHSPYSPNKFGAIGVDVRGNPIMHCKDKYGKDSFKFSEEEDLYYETNENEMIGVLNNGTPIYGDVVNGSEGSVEDGVEQTKDFPDGVYRYRYHFKK